MDHYCRETDETFFGISYASGRNRCRERCRDRCRDRPRGHDCRNRGLFCCPPFNPPARPAEQPRPALYYDRNGDEYECRRRRRYNDEEFFRYRRVGPGCGGCPGGGDDDDDDNNNGGGGDNNNGGGILGAEAALAVVRAPAAAADAKTFSIIVRDRTDNRLPAFPKNTAWIANIDRTSNIPAVIKHITSNPAKYMITVIWSNRIEEELHEQMLLTDLERDGLELRVRERPAAPAALPARLLLG